MSFSELVAEVKKLSPEERTSLAKWIVENLDELSEPEIEAVWVWEAQRRPDEREQELVTEVTAEGVTGRARAAIS